MRERTLGTLLIAAAACLWGTWPLYTHGSRASGLAIGFVTLAVMSLPAPFALRRPPFADRGAVWALVIVGLADAANVVLYFSALSRGPVVIAVLTHYLAPGLVGLLAPLTLGEPRSRRALIATPVVLVGLALVLGPAGPVDTWLTTALLGAGSAIFYATLVLASRRAARAFTPVAVTSLHSVVSIAALALVFRAEVLPPDWQATAPIIIAALVNGLLAALMFNRALVLVGAQRVGLFTYLEPVTAAVIGVLVLDEPFGLAAAAGLLLVLGAGAWNALEPEPSAHRAG
ncbi:MAG: DMT family transporter [Myxococcaceae bacterium]